MSSMPNHKRRESIDTPLILFRYNKKELTVASKRPFLDLVVITIDSRPRGVFTILIITVSVYSTFTSAYL